MKDCNACDSYNSSFSVNPEPNVLYTNYTNIDDNHISYIKMKDCNACDSYNSSFSVNPEPNVLYTAWRNGES